jgi:hypothetical protein
LSGHSASSFGTIVAAIVWTDVSARFIAALS